MPRKATRGLALSRISGKRPAPLTYATHGSRSTIWTFSSGCSIAMTLTRPQSAAARGRISPAGSEPLTVCAPRVTSHSEPSPFRRMVARPCTRCSTAAGPRSSGAMAVRGAPPIVATSRLQQWITPRREELAPLQPPCCNNRRKCSGSAGSMTQLCSEVRSNASPASTRQQRPPAASISTDSASAVPPRSENSNQMPSPLGAPLARNGGALCQATS